MILLGPMCHIQRYLMPVILHLNTISCLVLALFRIVVPFVKELEN